MSIRRSRSFGLGLAASGSPPARATSSSLIAARIAARPLAVSQWSILGRFRRASRRANGLAPTWLSLQERRARYLHGPTALMTAGVCRSCAVLNCRPPCRSARKERASKETSMASYGSERPIDPHVSLYLQRPLRTLKEAEQDSDASAHHPVSLPSPPESPAPSPPASRVHLDAARPIYLAIIAL